MTNTDVADFSFGGIWLNDEDAREQKLYRYWKHIVNREE